MKQEYADWLSDLSDRYGRMVFATAYKILGNAEDADDIYQDVFLKILGRQKVTSKQNNIRDWGAYLRVTATRVAIDLLRKRSKWKVESLDAIAEMESPIRNPHYQANEQQKAALLRRALCKLSEREAKVFALRYFDDLPYEQIAEHLEISADAVGVTLHRARSNLREFLQPYEPVETDRTNNPIPKSISIL